MDVDVIIESLPLYGQGALVTLALLVLSLGIGLLFALPLAMLRSLPSPWVWRTLSAISRATVSTKSSGGSALMALSAAI